MQNRLTGDLMTRWPQFPLLGEESTADEQRQLLKSSPEGLWCLDPLDGTSNFAAGIPFFSVSLALLIEGQPAMGLVYDPVREECFSAIAGEGVWLNGQPLRKHPLNLSLKQCIAVVDYKRLAPELATRLATDIPFSSQRSFGSVALDWAWLAAGRYHVYLHGKQKLWDFAAGTLILAEAGGHAVTLDSEPVYVADIAPRSAVAALDDRLFGEWRNWLMGDR
jgi:myo-inositol-1(or 4)-monophosphatase